MKNKITGCLQAEELIIQKLNEEISSVDDEKLSAHLAGCRACRQFEISVTQMKRSAADMKEEIQPDPQTLKNLNSYFNKKYAGAGFWDKFFTGIISFLRKPVPLYQAAVPVLCTVLIIIFLKPGMNITLGTALKPQIESTGLPETLQENPLNSDWKKVIQEQKGISASEDSIFSKTYFTTM